MERKFTAKIIMQEVLSIDLSATIFPVNMVAEPFVNLFVVMNRLYLEW